MFFYMLGDSSERGLSAVELLCALTILAMLALIGFPTFVQTIERSRHGSAVRHALSDFREARSQAISTGWQFRVVGFDTNGGSLSNRYRVFGRSSTSVSWPLDNAAPFQSSTALATPWVEVAEKYYGIGLDASSTRFELTFDSRGAAVATGFSPLRVFGADGIETNFTVSPGGKVKIQ